MRINTTLINLDFEKMFLHNVVYGLVLSAVVTSAFNPYYKAPPPKVAEVGGSEKVHEWKSLKDFKVPRDAQPFRPVVKGPVDVESLKPLKEVKIKKLPPRVCTFEEPTQ